MLSGCVAALLNACVRVGRLPPAWALCRITPIHKGGDATVAGNYRGIAVSTVLAKLYASLLTRRLSEWSERHNLRAVGQAGFRADHSTLDLMLVLRTLIESARAVREPLFACFVDFQKAYDSVCSKGPAMAKAAAPWSCRMVPAGNPSPVCRRTAGCSGGTSGRAAFSLFDGGEAGLPA